MANLTITKCSPVKIIEQVPPIASGATITVGQAVKLDGSTGKVNLALATTSGNALAIGIAISGSAETGGRPTLVRVGYLDVGDALDALNFGASVYLSDTAGTLADAAGTVSKIVGTVVPGFGNGATADKLLRVQL